MQNENDDYLNAQNDYFKRLNGVNLLLLKQHAFLLQKKQYEEQIAELDKLIKDFKENPDNHSYLTVEFEFESLHKIIKMNKKQIAHLQSKLQQRDVMTIYLTQLLQARKKYEKLIDSEYQNGIQQKLSMIRGKVDDLKKKIKEINKDILSSEQQHSVLIDQYSFDLKTLESYKQKNKQLSEQIERFKAAASKK